MSRITKCPVLVGLLVGLLGGCSAGGPVPTVAAAQSLRNVLPVLAAAFTDRTGIMLRFTYGGSGTLRAQVEAGAPVDAVIFASPEQVDRLIASGRVRPGTRRVVARNALVLAGRRDAPDLGFATLASLPPGERIAIGHPDAAPVGVYARETLQRLGVWSAVQDRLVYAGHVAAVLAYVRRGEVAAGIVYRSDLDGLDDVRVLDTAPPGAPVPQVVAAVTRDASRPQEAERFLAFLASSTARGILAQHGFAPPDGGT